MNFATRKRLLERVLQRLAEAAELIEPAQGYSDCIGARPDVDGAVEFSLRAIHDARGLTRWALSLLEDGAAAKRMP